MFLRTETTVVLPINILMDTLENYFKKRFKANFTANISFIFMWYLASLTDQFPTSFWFLIWAPQPRLDASLYKVTVEVCHSLVFGKYLARFPSPM